MGRAKSQKNTNQEAHKLHGIKHGSIKKNKDMKFKNTPTGKMTVIGKSKIQNVSMSPQENKNAQKGIKGSKNQTLPKQTFKSNVKQGFSTKKQIVSNKVEEKSSNGKLIFDPKEALEQFDDSNSDINEKNINMQKSANLNKTDESFEDDSETDGPDIFGESLRDESDEDDTDFKEENEEFDEDDDDDESNEDESNEDDSDENDDSNDEENVEHKGIKMFKGLRSKTKINDKKDQENDDDESDDSEDEDEEKLEEEESDDDIPQKQLHNIKHLNQDISMESDEDDEDSEDSDEDDNDDEEIGLKTLLGKSIEDDDDDKDYNEENESDEDDDISSENEDDEENGDGVIQMKVISNKQGNEAAMNEKKTSEEIKLEERVIIIENVPTSITSKNVKNLAKAHGIVEQVHLEPLHIYTTENPEKQPGKGKEKLISYTAKILYKTNEYAQTAAQKMHGLVIDGHYLSVQTMAEYNGPFNAKKAVFITNLKKDVEMNSIWQAFSECGAIKCVELVRNKVTNLCEHGYIHYFTEEGASCAFKSSNRLKVMGQKVVVLRVRSKDEVIYREEKCVFKLNLNDSTTASIGLKRPLSNIKDEDKGLKKFKNNSEKPVVKQNVEKNKQRQENDTANKSNAFQGLKVSLKNKKKKNKLDKKKKKIASKFTAKSAKA